MDVAMSPEAIGLFRLILTEGPRSPDLAGNFYRVGQDRVRADAPDQLAIQFFDLVRGELHLRVVTGLTPDDLARAVENNVEQAVRTFWRAVSREAADEVSGPCRLTRERSPSFSTRAHPGRRARPERCWRGCPCRC
jgi:hypothetical protein